MSSWVSVAVVVVAVVFAVTRVGTALTRLDAAATAFRDELAAEHALRLCAARLARGRNWRDAAVALSALDPARADTWQRTSHELIGDLDVEASECQDDRTPTWRATAHAEQNPRLPAVWPNWRPRFEGAP